MKTSDEVSYALILIKLHIKSCICGIAHLPDGFGRNLFLRHGVSQLDISYLIRYRGLCADRSEGSYEIRVFYCYVE